MLEGDIDVRADPLVRRDGIKQAACNLVRICVQETDPAKFFDFCQPSQKERQPIFQAKIFVVVAGCASEL